MYPQETRIYFTLLAGIITLLLLMAFFMVTIIRYHKRRSVHKKGSIQQQFKYLEAEKGRIAADLHDDVGAMLSAIKLRLQFVQPKEVAMQKNLDFAGEQIDVIMQKLRHISQTIMPSILKRKGSREAFLELIEYMLLPTGIKVCSSIHEIHTDPETEVHLFRIVQEILNNIIKHSKAGSVHMHLEQNNEGIVLQVKDDGKGFDENEVRRRNKGAGLKNIMARVDIINAKIYLRTKPGKGVHYQIEINKP